MPPASQLAVQMYTVRDYTKTACDLAEALRKISDIGYPAVQLSAVGAMNGDAPEVDAKTARRMLDDNGLACIATHRSWDALRDDTEAEIVVHHTLGCMFTAIGGLPKEYGDRGAAGYADFVQDAAPVIARLKTRASRGAITTTRTNSPRLVSRAARRCSTRSLTKAGRNSVSNWICIGHGTRARTPARSFAAAHTAFRLFI